jgi:hypothetical protein
MTVGLSTVQRRLDLVFLNLQAQSTEETHAPTFASQTSETGGEKPRQSSNSGRARDEQDDRGNVVAEAILAGEEIGLRAKKAAARLAFLHAPVVGLAKHVFVRDVHAIDAIGIASTNRYTS